MSVFSALDSFERRFSTFAIGVATNLYRSMIRIRLRLLKRMSAMLHFTHSLIDFGDFRQLVELIGGELN